MTSPTTPPPLQRENANPGLDENQTSQIVRDEAALEAVNHSLRALIEEVRLSEAPASVLEETRAAIEEARIKLAPHRYEGPLGQASFGIGNPLVAESISGDLSRLFPYSPVIGCYNPIAPPIHFDARDGVVYGRVRWDAQYCGPPNHVHGGIIAAAFDELLGAVNVVNQLGAMTGTLTIRYRKPTPVNAEVRMEGRQTGSEGRKVFAEGKMWHGDTLLAEAEGIFIQIAGDFRSEMLKRGEPEDRASRADEAR